MAYQHSYYEDEQEQDLELVLIIVSVSHYLPKMMEKQVMMVKAVTTTDA